MKMRVFLSLLLCLFIARAEPEFVGFLTTKDSAPLFVLIVSPGTSPQWAQLGGSVGGYVLAEYRAKDDVLVLRKDGVDSTLKMKIAKVQSSKYSDYTGDPLPLESACRLIGSSDGWSSGVSYRVFRDNEGNLCLSASKKEGRRIAFRFVTLTPQSVPPIYHELASNESGPWPIE